MTGFLPRQPVLLLARAEIRQSVTAELTEAIEGNRTFPWRRPWRLTFRAYNVLMCGRFTLRAPPSVVAEHFALFEMPPFTPQT